MNIIESFVTESGTQKEGYNRVLGSKKEHNRELRQNDESYLC
jgi:hypothetical protein